MLFDILEYLRDEGFDTAQVRLHSTREFGKRVIYVEVEGLCELDKEVQDIVHCIHKYFAFNPCIAVYGSY